MEERIKRYNVNFKQGLSSELVNQRKKDKLVNKSTKLFRKPNILNISNIITLLFVVLFTPIILSIVTFVFNVFIGVISDVKVAAYKAFLYKEKPQAKVIRDGKQVIIKADEIVLDDIIYLEKGDVINVDGVILDGEIGVNENMLNGNPIDKYFTVNDSVYKGTVVTSGTAYISADKIGNNCFVDQLQRKTKKIRRPFSSLTRFLDIFFIASLAMSFVTILVGLVTFSDYFKGFFFIAAIAPIGAALLVSYILLFVSYQLSRKKVYVQDFYSIPSLTEMDIICFDKTGTITNHELVVKKTVIFDGRIPESNIAQDISNVLCAVNEENTLSNGLKKVYDLELSAGVHEVLHFSNVNEYMGASFKGGRTLLIGNPEAMQINNKIGVLKRCEEFTKEGLRVYVLAEGNGSISNNKYNGELEALAMIVMEEKTKEDIAGVFKWFTENNKEIKIISGDDALITSTICYQAGLKEAINYVSLENVSLRDTKLLADKYTVFGKASPEQKDIIIDTLRKKGKKVAMVGDGDNDILALKRANLSICMKDSSNAVKRVSHMVIGDNECKSLIEVSERGRSLINNLQRAMVIHSLKTIFMFIMTIAFIIMNVTDKLEFPSLPSVLVVWDVVTAGAVAVGMMFEKDTTKNKGSMIANILKRSIPGAVILSISIILIFVLYLLEQKHLVNYGIYNVDTALAMSAITFTVISGAILYKDLAPLNQHRRILGLIYIAANVFILLITLFVSYGVHGKPLLVPIAFNEMNGPTYFISALIAVTLSALYILIYDIVKVFRKDNKDEN